MNKAFLLKPLVMSMALALTACGGSSGGSSDSGDNNNDNGNTGGDTTSGNNDNSGTAEDFVNQNEQVAMSFDLSGAVALVASEDVVAASAAPGTGLPVLKTMTGSAQKLGIPVARIKPRNSGESRSESTVAGSNLMALDAEGNLTPALNTNYPVKVMYTVTNPDGSKVYIALDPGWWDHENSYDEDGNYIDFARVIAESNCALFEVDVESGESSCVSPGLLVQQMNDAYMKAVSGNQKPIQFDDAGNMYFAATSFTVQSESWEQCFFDQAAEQEVCETWGYKWLDHVEWQPTVYQRTIDAESATEVTQDNENIEFFSVLSSGELVYQSRSEETWNASLKMLQGDSVIDLTDGTGWGVDFFTVDDRNAVIFGQGDWSGNGANGLRFARPRTSFGVEKASLDTSLFGGNDGHDGWGNPKPRRLMVSDNGRIYGVFEGGRSTYNDTTEEWSWESVLTVYQILPFDGVPKLELTLGEDWWAWMQDTPFQVSGDMLYYKDTVDVPYLGTSDVIVMVNLETREHTQLLTPNSDTGEGRYEIYNWRLAGEELHFSGLKKDNNSVVTGVIDTTLFDEEVEESAYFTLTEVASASGAASAIQDIEVIRQVNSEEDPAVEPTMTFHQSMDNLFSMSVDFSATMNWDSVEAALTLTEGADTDVELMKVWINKTLHIIPDLDGLADSSSTTPMAAGTQYTLAVATGTEDSFGNTTTSDSSSAITTRPANGWYTNTAEQLIFAGRDDNEWGWQTYDLTQAALPANFELVFDAKNFNWDGVELFLMDIDGADHSRQLVKMGLNGWSWMDYADTTSSWGTNQWVNGETNSIFNGSWKTYRVRVFGNNLKVESKPADAADNEFETHDMFTVDDLHARTGTNYRLMFRVAQPIGLDNLEINTLDSSGIETAAGTLEDFSSYDVGASTFATDLTDSYNDIWQ